MKQHFVGPIRPWDFIAKHIPTSENAPSCPRADFSEVPVGNTLRGMLGPLVRGEAFLQRSYASADAFLYKIKAIHKATGLCSTLQLFASRNALLSAKKIVDPDTADEAVFGTDTNADLYPAIGVRSVLPPSPGKARHKHKPAQKLTVATEDYDFTNTCLGIEVRPHLHFDPFVDCPQDELYHHVTADVESEDSSGDSYSFESASPDGSLFRRQLVHHARAQLDRQHRAFFFQLVIVHRFARIIRWDRSGAIVTSRFDYRTSPQILAEFFSRFAHMSDEQRGSDPSASLASEEERQVFRTAVEQFLDRMNGKLKDGVRVRRIPHAEKSLNDDFPTWRIRMVDKASFRETDLIVNCPINTQAPICSRATRAYLAYDTRQKRLVFLKDTWRTCDEHVWAESRTYKYLTSPPAVPHMPVVHYAGDVRGSDGKVQTTVTQDYARDKSGSWQKPRRNFLAHVHHRVVQDIVYRLDTAEDEKEFTLACHDALVGACRLRVLSMTKLTSCVVAMQGAYEKGLVHHDISSGNIMLTGDGKAVLNDWDWAGRKEDPGPSVVRHSYVPDRASRLIYHTGNLALHVDDVVRGSVK